MHFFSGGDDSDLMSMLMGGGGRQSSKRVQKVKPTKKALEITLETAYKGDVIKVPVKRYRNCVTCKGKGGSDVKNCG
jgi:DnaJ-class molecular chaperone